MFLLLTLLLKERTMKKFVLAIATLLFVAVSLVGCGKKDEVSFDSLEEAKQTARENAMYNAQAYRQANPRYTGWNILGRGDSTQTNVCPQGDGWATLEFSSSDKAGSLKVKCSTVSSATGCLEDADFKTKSWATEDGQCAPTNRVPYPLPKIAK